MVALLDSGSPVDSCSSFTWVEEEQKMGYTKSWTWTERRDTALSMACSQGNIRLAKILLERGANRYHKSCNRAYEDSKTPIELARQHGHITCANFVHTFRTSASTPPKAEQLGESSILSFTRKHPSIEFTENGRCAVNTWGRGGADVLCAGRAPMVQGIHTAEFRIIQGRPTIGVAPPGFDCSSHMTEWMHKQPRDGPCLHCWGFSSDTGSRLHWKSGQSGGDVDTQWQGMKGAKHGDRVTLLLDLRPRVGHLGMLSVFVNGERLGTMVNEISGPLCWWASLWGKGDSVRIAEAAITISSPMLEPEPEPELTVGLKGLSDELWSIVINFLMSADSSLDAQMRMPTYLDPPGFVCRIRTSSVRDLAQLASVSRECLRVALYWSQSQSAFDLPAVQEIYAGSTSMRESDGSIQCVALDKPLSKLRGCMLVALLCTLPTPDELYYHEDHMPHVECERCLKEFPAMSTGSQNDWSCPSCGQSEEYSWYRCYPQVRLDFQAVQIDYFYGRFDPRLRFTDPDNRDDANQIIDEDEEYRGASGLNGVRNAWNERKYINRKLGLEQACFKDGSAAPPRLVSRCGR